MHELVEDMDVDPFEEDEDGNFTYSAFDPLKPTGDNLLRGGAVDVVADRKTNYGITVRNRTTMPLYVWAFFFECNSLAISACLRYRRPVR